jgi:hypothetical protein
MSSDCNNPDVMFYTVTDCSNQSNIYQGIHIYTFAFISVFLDPGLGSVGFVTFGLGGSAIFTMDLDPTSAEIPL